MPARRTLYLTKRTGALWGHEADRQPATLLQLGSGGCIAKGAAKGIVRHPSIKPRHHEQDPGQADPDNVTPNRGDRGGASHTPGLAPTPNPDRKGRC